MESESLRNIRTMRQVKTSLEVAKGQKARAMSSLSKTRETKPDTTFDRQLEVILAKERAHVAAYEASMKRSRGRILKLREKLAMVIKRNEALTQLRSELQEARREGQKHSVTHEQASEGRFYEVGLKY